MEDGGKAGWRLRPPLGLVTKILLMGLLGEAAAGKGGDRSGLGHVQESWKEAGRRRACGADFCGSESLVSEGE